MLNLAGSILWESWLVLCELAPYLLFGFLIAGGLSIFISPQSVERHLGRGGFGPVWRAAVFGIPLPLCSCGVIPVAASMRRHGASRAAVAAFLLSTPQTGMDSIAATYALLGPIVAVFRPIAALATGLLGGALVLLLGGSNGRQAGEESPPPCQEECCCGHRAQSAPVRALKYGLVTLPRDVAFSLLLGIMLAGAMSALAPESHQLHAYLGGGIVSILILMAAGVPIYVCATASVPIAAGFMHMGASPGAALAFLISGPATNLATFTTVWKLLGARSTLLYLTAVAASAVGCGLALDKIVSLAAAALPAMDAHAHEMTHAGWLSSVWAVALLAVLGYSCLAGWRDEHEHEEA